MDTVQAPKRAASAVTPNVDNLHGGAILVSRRADGEPQLSDAGNLHDESLYKLKNDPKSPQHTTYLSLEDFRVSFTDGDDPVHVFQYGKVNANREFEAVQFGPVWLLGLQANTKLGTGRFGGDGRVYAYRVTFISDGKSADPDVGIEC
jgi:hypothetical protein